MLDQQKEQRALLYSLLGDLPASSAPPSAVSLGVEERPAYLLERLLLDLNGLEKVPAYLVRPKLAQGPLPAILYNHSHGGNYALGKEELLQGFPGYLQQPPYAEELTARGYAVLAIDARGFGERRGRSESEIFKEMLWRGRVMWGMMVFDSLRALDYLAARADVDTGRLGTLGLSMGSTMAWWTAALDTRLKVCVDLCCLTDFQALIETRGLDAHGIYYYVPGLLKHFTTAGINALIAPRPHLALAGDNDCLTPPEGLSRIDRELRQVYAEKGAPEAWALKRYACGHMETAEMRQEVAAFLARWM